jgi:hypothetical protein
MHNRKVTFFCPSIYLFSETAKVFLLNVIFVLQLFFPKRSRPPTYLRLKRSLTERQLHKSEERLASSLLLKHKRS